MIFGTGVDIIEISRINQAIADERFIKRVYTDYEISESKSLSHRLAGYFAAKEALLKAMGTGLSGFSWQEIEVRHDRLGAPLLEVYDKVKLFLTEKNVTKLHLSISHCRDFAVAQVILEAFE